MLISNPRPCVVLLAISSLSEYLLAGLSNCSVIENVLRIVDPVAINQIIVIHNFEVNNNFYFFEAGTKSKKQKM